MASDSSAPTIAMASAMTNSSNAFAIEVRGAPEQVFASLESYFRKSTLSMYQY